VRALAYIGSPPQPRQAAVLLPAVVLLVAAAVSFALPPRLSGKPRAA
jgi:hypothetical protein